MLRFRPIPEHFVSFSIFHGLKLVQELKLINLFTDEFKYFDVFTLFSCTTFHWLLPWTCQVRPEIFQLFYRGESQKAIMGKAKETAIFDFIYHQKCFIPL